MTATEEATVLELPARAVEPLVVITEPGVYFDIPEVDYHADPVPGGSLSSTGARTLATRTPAHFAYERTRRRPDRSHYDLGHAVHTEVLGVGGEIVVVAGDGANPNAWATKSDKARVTAAREAGQTPVKPADREAIDTMVAAIRADDTAGPCFARTDCRPEVTVIAQDPETGVWCRARIDWLLPVEEALDAGAPLMFVDLKTSGEDVDERHLTKAMVNYGYAQQFDHYMSCLRWALKLPDDYPIGVTNFDVETSPPHLVNLGGPDEEALAYAHEDNRRARHLYARCTRDGVWPGHQRPGGDPLTLALPGWRRAAYERTYPTGRYEPDTDMEDDDA